MSAFENLTQWILGILLIAASLGVITSKKPIHASLCFLATLFLLATTYLQLSAQFIAVMQVLVYAGAILVIFVFVIVLFQDAHQQLAQFKPQSKSFLIALAATFFVLILFFLGYHVDDISRERGALPTHYGTVQSLGKALYLDFFFPFEAIVMLFLVAGIGALYIAKREK